MIHDELPESLTLDYNANSDIIVSYFVAVLVVTSIRTSLHTWVGHRTFHHLMPLTDDLTTTLNSLPTSQLLKGSSQI